MALAGEKLKAARVLIEQDLTPSALEMLRPVLGKVINRSFHQTINE